MAVGHGQLGGRSNLRTFRDMVLLSGCRRDTYVEVEAGLLSAQSWSSDSGSYTIAPGITFDGIRLDVTGVRTLTEILTRVETHGECVSTAGTYMYSPGVDFLRIHLSGGVDPNDISVLITTTFGFTTAGQEHEHMICPILGPELLVDGDAEDWTTSTNLASYTEDLSGSGWAVNQETTDVWSKASSIKLSSTGAASGSAAVRQSPNTNIGGFIYRVCGYYQTPSWAPSTQHVYIRYGTTVSLGANGRTADATLSTGYELDPTFGEWRFFTYDFMAHEAAARLAFRLVNASLAASQVLFDELSLRTIWGWRYYRPIIAEGGVPEVVMAASDIYPGSEETGTGQLQLINGPGDVLERLFSPPFFYISRDVRWLHGGVFPGGQEILYNDLEPGFCGRVAGPETPEVSDERASLQVEDQRSILTATLPTRAYNETDHPNVESRDLGRPRPLVFGQLLHARPARIDFDGTTGYGIYELCDTTDWADGIGGAGPAAGGSVRAYADEEAADKQDQTRMVVLDPTVDYSSDLTAGTMEIHHDVRVIEVTRENNKIDFDIGGGALVATIPEGWYIIGNGDPSTATFRRGLLEQVRSTMSAASGESIGAVYAEDTHKVNISKVSKGVLNLRWQSGANRASSIGRLLGYEDAADDTGSVSYDADSALFEDPDSTHIIRADIAGFADDASGTYTGVAGNTIEKGPDILRFIFSVILGQPQLVDEESFIAARSTFPAALGVYLGGLASVTGGGGFDMTVSDVIDRLENGASADDSFLDIVPDGTGVFFYQPRASSAPASAPHIYDRDYLSFRGYFVGDDVAAVTRVNYSQNPSTGVVKGSEITNGDTVLLFGRPQTKTFDTFLLAQADADACCANLLLLTRAGLRHFEFDVVGKLLRAKKGDVILLTRAQALQGVGESGGLDADEFVIMELRKNFDTGVCHAVVHTNITP